MAIPRWTEWSGSGNAGFSCGGIEACVCGGFSDRFCTSTIVPTMIASPANDNTPPRQYFRGIRRVVRRPLPSRSSSTRQTCTGSAIFFTVCSPVLVTHRELVPDLLVDLPEMQMPPGSARLSSRAATLTPSP